MSMFEKAARLKLRFDSPVGLISAEDLFDLPLTSKTGKANLDDIARHLHRELKEDGDISFVTPKQAGENLTQLKFDLVKYVIDVKIAERDAAAQAAVNREKKQQILAIIAQKQNEALSQTSIEELQRMVDAL